MKLNLLNYIDLYIVLSFLNIIVSILLSVALLTLVERKIMASIQIRRGPNIIGYGILQPLADGLKLLIKELIIPLKGNKYLFMASPVLFLALSLLSWVVIPFENANVASPALAILVFVAVSSLSVYGILLGGWASNSRYAFLGAIRSASQMISYELVLGLLVLLALTNGGSYIFTDISLAQDKLSNIWLFLPMFIIYIVCVLAETNRTPFDLPEAEAELVAGYSVEYSSAPFAFYFIGEYGNLIVWSMITSILFFGGYHPTDTSSDIVHFIFQFLNTPLGFIIKTLFFMYFFCWVRATLPRYRYDQLLELAWRFYLPLATAFTPFIIIIYRLGLGFLDNTEFATEPAIPGIIIYGYDESPEYIDVFPPAWYEAIPFYKTHPHAFKWYIEVLPLKLAMIEKVSWAKTHPHAFNWFFYAAGLNHPYL